MKNVLIDGILGGILIGIISYLSSIYGDKPFFYKILAFMWAVPLTFFFFINMASRDGKQPIADFSKHAILGTLLTFIIAIVTLNIMHLNIDKIIIITFIYAIITTFLYFSLKIYNY
jgi:hypothetical protein